MRDPTGPARRDPDLVRWGLIAVGVGYLSLFVLVPLANVVVQAFADGVPGFWRVLARDPDTRHAVRLTLAVAAAAVAANLSFGLAAAWAIARFRFPGRAILIALIDLPFSVSPVIAGLVYVLLFGLQGYGGPWLRAHGITIVFALPGLILATIFVTFPFIARELIPVMEATGADEEIAAITLGASGWQTFRRVTLPNVKWGLLYGVILCNARAMGEFGAAYVVSGHIAGKTDTLPLRAEKLLQEYDVPGAFAVASVLASMAVLTLAAKALVEWRARRVWERP